MQFQYYMPTKIIFGAGKLADMETITLPGKKPLIVSSSGGSMRKTGVMDRLLKYLEKNSCHPVFFEKIIPNPVLEHVNEGADFARQNNCDFIIAIGGGSAIDAAKAIAATATNEGNFWDYIGTGSGGKKSLKVPALPLVAIPTTAGTGTEADPWCVITNSETKEKIGWGHESTFPVISIVDPELMLTVPSSVTAMTGMDAFFHSAEAYLATCSQPASDLLSLESIKLITQFLPKAVQDGTDLEARTQLAWASTAAGLCETYSSCIAHHSMEHALSAYSPDLPHGAGLVMLSIPFFEVMAKALPERCAQMAQAMGADISKGSVAEQGQMFIKCLEKLIKDIGLDKLKLTDFDLKIEMASDLADNALYAMSGLFGVTPVDLSKEDVKNIFIKAFNK